MSILINTKSAVTLVTLNRPRFNLLDQAVIDDLTAAFEQLDGAPVVISGLGDTFSAGVDVKAFAQLDPSGRVDFARAITKMTAAILSVRAPVIAAVPGHAIGGGLVLTLCCDYRIVADNPGAKFGLTEAKAGVPFPSGPAQIIRDEIPAPLLRRLTLTSAEMNARDLYATGLVDELCEANDLLPKAEEMATRLAQQPGFEIVKTQIRGALRERVIARHKAGEEPGFS